MTRCIHSWTDDTATIEVAGIERPLRVLHVTDSHISVPHEEVDQPYVHYGARIDGLFADFPTLQTFAAQMERARAEAPDLIGLTGDHVNYPSPTAVAAVERLILATGRDSVFTAGNHDWRYAGLPGSDEDLRTEWRERSLLPLYRGRRPHAGSLDLGGVRFVAIDNSTRQVDAEQLAFFDRALAGGLPVVLLTHMPFRLPGDTAAHRAPPPSSGQPIPLCGDPESDPATDDFIGRLLAARNLVAVLCGHIHVAGAYRIHEDAVQYVTGPGFLNQSRMVTICPRQVAEATRR